MNAFYILYGSVLAFFSSWLVNSLKNRSDRREKTNNFKILLKRELLSLIKGFEKLKTILQLQQYFQYNTLDLLGKGISSVEQYKKEAIYLSLDQQEKFVDLLSDVSTFITEVRDLQNSYYTEIAKFDQPADQQKEKDQKQQMKFKNKEEVQNIFNSAKAERMTDLVDIKRRLNDFAKEL